MEEAEVWDTVVDVATATRRQIRRRLVPDVTAIVREYLLNRSTRERASVHEAKIKAGLMAVLEQSGELDPDSGHRIILLDDPLPYVQYKGEKGVEKQVTGIQRQERKGALVLNEERTLAFLKRRAKLLADCTTTVTVINEDALLAANFEKRISDADLNSLYDQSDPTYAFYLLED